MAAAIAITRLDLSASELRAAAGKEKNGGAARRMLALALCWKGPTGRPRRTRAAGIGGRCATGFIATIRTGFAGLRNRAPPGAQAKLTEAQKAELARLVEARPRPRHGVVRWRRVDLREELKRRFGVELHERSVGRITAVDVSI